MTQFRTWYKDHQYAMFVSDRIKYVAQERTQGFHRFEHVHLSSFSSERFQEKSFSSPEQLKA